MNPTCRIASVLIVLTTATQAIAAASPTTVPAITPQEDPFLGAAAGLQLVNTTPRITAKPAGRIVRASVVLRGYITGNYSTIDYSEFLRNKDNLVYARKTGQSVRGKIEGLNDMNQKNVVVSVRRAGWVPDLIKLNDLVDIASCTGDGSFHTDLLEAGDYIVTAEVETLDPAAHRIVVMQKGTARITVERDKAPSSLRLKVEPVETR